MIIKTDTICRFIAINQNSNTNKKDIVHIFEDKKELWTKNSYPSTDTLKQLTELNNSWFNIYKIINDFYSSRTEKNLIHFNKIGIDLDYYDKELPILLSEIKEKLWFLPNKINKTFKWYHIFFDIPWKYNLISFDNYLKLYDYINSYIWWDKAMRDITWILKVEWYLDLKDNRNYLIENKYNNSENNILTSEKIEEIIWEEINLDLNRQEEYILKINKKENNKKRINSIDALDLIQTLNNDFWYNIKIKDNWIEWTDGLKLYKEDWIYSIKDFSNKSRYWNQNFLLNYVLENENKDDKMKKYVMILSKFWINLQENYSPSKFPLFYLLWFKKDDVVNDVNNKIMWNEKWLLLKLLISYNYLINKNKSNWVEIKDIIELLWISNSSTSRDKIREWFIKLSYLKIKIVKNELQNNKIVKVEHFKNLIDLKIINNTLIKLDTINFTNLINVNLELLKIKNDNKFYFSLILTSNLQKFKKFKISINELLEITWFSSYDKLREKYLKPLKDEKHIRDYKKINSYIEYF